MSDGHRRRGSEGRRRRDEIAARAAKAWSRGDAASIEEAIDRACGEEPAVGGGPVSRPGEGRVRLHLRGLAESMLGREGYLRSAAEVLGHAAAAMEALEAAPIEARTTLAGRAARGRIEGEVRLHLRAETDAPIGLMAAALVEVGFAEPTFDSFEARGPSTGCGRLHRLTTERDGVAVSVTRCPPRQIVPGRFDLVRGRPVATLDLASLEARIAALLEGRDPF